MAFTAPFTNPFIDTSWRPVFLLRDDFITADASPVESPHACEPIGVLTFVQATAGSRLSIANGKLVFPVNTGITAGNSGAYAANSIADPTSVPYTRAAGLVILTKVSVSVSNGQNIPALWKVTANSVNGTAANGARYGLVRGTNNLMAALDHTGAAFTLWPWAILNDCLFAVVLRSTGYFLYGKTNLFTNWSLLWVGVLGNTTPMYAVVTSGSGGLAEMETWRVTQLPSPFDSDYGLVTQRFIGAVELGQSYVHESDSIIEFICTTLPSSGSIDVQFRLLNASNTWSLQITSAGALTLYEIVAGVSTSRGTGTVTAGARVTIMFYDVYIRVVIGQISAVVYDTATNFADNVSGVVQSLGTGGVLSDMNIWPVVLPAHASGALDAAVYAS